MGTPEFAVGTLQRLVEGGYNVVAVVTQPDKPVGRHGSVLQPSEVKKYALEHSLPVLQPEKMKDPAFVSQLRAYNADLQVVVAFRMLPEVVWAMPRFGTFNVHAALLPQYRGAAPINWAVINGERQTGVTTFFLDHDIDTGRIIMQRPFDIPDDADVEYVYDGLMRLGADVAIETIDRIIEGDGHVDSMPQEQLIAPTTELHSAPKIFKETCQIDWQQPAKRIYDFIRGLSPYPGAWTTLVTPDGKRTVLKIYQARFAQQPATNSRPDSHATSSLRENSGENAEGASPTLATDGKHLYVGNLELLELQLTGKKRMMARDFLNGFRGIEDCHLE